MKFTKSIINKNVFNAKILGQQPYVDQNGQTIKPNNRKKIYIIIGIIAGIVLLTIVIILIANALAKNSKCNNIESVLKDAGYKYAKDSNKLPTIVSDPVTYNVSELISKGYINANDFSMNKSTCDGTVKITNIGDSYIETVNVTGCDYCTTDTRYGTNWSSESDKKPTSGVYDVIPYYNYVSKTNYHTDWTGYYTPDQLTANPFKDYKDSRLKSIPTDAKNIIIDHDDITYYHYRDQQWKYYRNPNNNYSQLSCTQPAGYANQDASTAFQTAWTDWSLEAPAELGCNHSESRTGYRWYKMVNNNKEYWNNGAYSPTNPDETNNSYTQDKKDSATVWHYYQILYRWYNGSPRGYSSYMSAPTSSYPYRDDELTIYTSWTTWNNESKLNSSNKYYRTEETQTRTRYRLTYDEYSFNLLDTYLSKSDFESKVGRPLIDVYNDQKYAVITQYKYISRKK